MGTDNSKEQNKQGAKGQQSFQEGEIKRTIANKFDLCQRLENHDWLKDEVGGGSGEVVEIVDEEEMMNLPHKHLGVVLAVHPCGVFQLGTGILISRDLVLTCAHVTHSKQYQDKPFPELYFYPRQHGKLAYYIDVEESATPDEYRSEEKWLYRRVYDYTLLKLKQKVDDFDFLPLSGDLPHLDKETTLSIFGYPESKYDIKNKKPVGVKQYGLTKTSYILDVYQEAGYMVHRIPTKAGQSGAPVIMVQNNGRMMIAGIHVGTPEEESNKYQEEFPELKKVNIAKLMNRLMVERLTAFAKQLGGQMFKVLAVDNAPYQNIQEGKKQWQHEKQELLLRIKKMEEEKQELQSPEQQKKQKRTTKQANAPKQSSKTKEEWNQGGYQFWLASRYAQAVECYRKALAIDPNDKNAHYRMGNVLSSLSRNEEALASYQKALEIDPNYSDAHNGMGNALKGLGRKEEALASYQKALEIDPNYKLAHTNMGYALKDLGRKEEALASYRQALAIDPNDEQAYYNMGNALDDLSRFNEAVTSYHRAIQIDHNYQLVYGNLQFILLNKTRTVARLAESVGFLEGVLLQHPDSQPAKNTVQILRAELKKLSQ